MADKAKRRRAEDERDAKRTKVVEQNGEEVFVPRSSARALTDACAIDAAARASARRCTLFGLDGSGVEFGPEAARALGSVPVKALDFPLELNFTADGRAAFKRALAGNRVIESIRIRATRLDGRCEGGWSADGSPFFADVQRLRRRGELEPIVVLGADDDDDDDDDDADDDDSEDDDHVECDGDGCGARLTGADVVFTCPEGRDYCSACRARLPKRPGGLVKTTAGARLAAAAAAESDDDHDD